MLNAEVTHANLHKALIIVTAADLIESLVKVLDANDMQLDKLQIKLNGVNTAEITAQQLVMMLRNIGTEFKPLVVKDWTSNNTDSEQVKKGGHG